MSPTTAATPADPTQEGLRRRAQFNTVVTYASLSALVVCPLLIALPPRKFDVYTVLLISGTAAGGNQVLSEYSGRGIADRIPTLRRLVGGTGVDAGVSAETRLRDGRLTAMEERSRRGGGVGFEDRDGGGAAARGQGTTKTTTMTTEAVARAVQEMRAAEEAGGQVQSGVGAGVREEMPRARKADWKVQRDAREKEALEDGRGYGGLIMDQIWEVWNWRRETEGEGEGAEKGAERKREEEGRSD